MIATIKNYLQKANFKKSEINAVQAYEIWSDSYDKQPGNLMLDLDETIFSGLLKYIDLKNKRVADVGCGTGRHWGKIYDKSPDLLLGFDVSPGMLRQLACKYPDAVTEITKDNLLASVADLSIDCLISTLTIAHIKNIEEAIASWARIVKYGGDLLLTDFHPVVLAKGGKRSFSYEGVSLSVKNYVHPLEKVKRIFKKYGFSAVIQDERKLNEKLRHYYEAKNAIPVYDRFKGMPLIYGLLLKKKRAA